METTLFLDCDGVLADFVTLATAILGEPPRQFEAQHGPETMWARLRAYDDFFFKLDPMPDALALWETVQHRHPVILTACPRSQISGWVEDQKQRWIQKVFGDVPVILAHKGIKHAYLRQSGDILVDDNTKYCRRWERAGGVFVHHVSAQDSLAALRALQPAWFA